MTEIEKKMDEELSDRDLLYNAVLKTIKEHGSNMEVGLVTAVLSEVEGDIIRRVNRQNLSVICDELKERTLRMSHYHPQSND